MTNLKQILPVLTFLLSLTLVTVAQETGDTILTVEQMNLYDLMNVKVVSAGKTDQEISKAGAAISVITSQQIEEYGYTSVGEALQSVPGFYLLTDHYQYNLGVRGINGGMRAWSRVVKVMINNQSVAFRSSAENWLGLELIPIAIIDRIEIVKGPSSALYGANAFLGIVNIITKDGKQINGGEIDNYLGAMKNIRYGLGILLGKKSQNWDLSFGGTVNYIDQSELQVKDIPGKSNYGENNFSQNDISSPMSLYAKISYSEKRFGTFKLDLSGQFLKKYGEFQDWAVLSHNNFINAGNLFIRTGYSKTLAGKLDNNLIVAYSQGQPTKNEKLATDQVGLADWMTREVGFKAINLEYNLQYNFKDDNNVALGVDYDTDREDLQTYYRNYRTGEKQATEKELGDTTFNNLGFYAQTIINPFQLLKTNYLNGFGIIGGVRYDINNIYGNTTNYKVAIVQNLSESTYAKVLYGTAFKAPAPTQLYTTILKPGGVIGNPDLKPERAVSYELEVGGRISDQLNYTFNAYYDIINDKVELVKSVSAASNVFADNISKIHSYGTEIHLTLNTNQYSSYLNFSYQKSTFKRENILTNKEETLDTRLYPSYMTKWGVIYKLPQYFLKISTEGQWVSYRYASDQNIFKYDPVYKNPYKLDAYILMDVTFSAYKLKLFEENNIDIQFKIKNILNTDYYFPGYNDYDIQGSQRSVLLKLKYRL